MKARPAVGNEIQDTVRYAEMAPDRFKDFEELTQARAS
jgi:hypothetical protein